MSESLPSVSPFRVVYSEVCREATRQLLVRATVQGRFAELAQVVRDIDTRLQWIPLDFGEPLRDFPALSLRLYVGVLAPLVVQYGVDEVRRIVYVTLPFRVLANCGL